MVARAAYTDQRQMHTKFSWGNLKRKSHLGDLDVNGRHIENECLCVDWVQVAPEMVQCWEGGGLVSTAMNPPV